MDCQATRERKQCCVCKELAGQLPGRTRLRAMGTRLVDVLCGEESDTPQGSEPVAKQARTDDCSMNVGQVTPPVVPGREAKGPEGSDVEFFRQ